MSSSIRASKLFQRASLIVSTILMSASAAAQGYNLDINRTEVVYLPTPAGAVVIGNPEIADISVHSADTLFLVGRGYGITNLIVLDKAGQKIMDASVTVSQPRAANNVRVLHLGKGRETYSCTPYCSPAPVLGDSPEFMGNYSGSALAIDNQTATGSLSNGGNQASGDPYSGSPDLSGGDNGLEVLE